MRFIVNPRPDRLPDEQREAVRANPGFGDHFTDHMVLGRWTRAEGWAPLEVVAYGPLSVSPAAMGIHYGQAIFEALKVYNRDDGVHALFRPERHAERLARSAERMAMPEVPADVFVGACALLAAIERAWVPSEYGTSLYLRPWMFATEENLGVRPADEYAFGIIACPASPIFSVEPVPITILVELDDIRAAVGGTGEAKFAGNYAAALRGHAKARAAGFDQVLWLDAAERRWIEELNGMNVFFVWERGGRRRITTPPLDGTILRGITRDTILTVLRDLGHDVAEERTSLDDLREGVAEGRLKEAFACGTAAVVAPIGRLVAAGEIIDVGGEAAGELTLWLRRLLLDLQHGREQDRWGFVRPVDAILDELGLADLVPAAQPSLAGGA